MSSPPFMPFYPADYLADTLHLNSEENSAYFLLILSMWRQGGRLENDAKKLARMARVDARRWHLVAPAVMSFFTEEDGYVRQRRLTREYEKALSKSEKRSAAGSAGGRAKALKSKELPVANDSGLPKHSSDIRYQTSERDKTETRAGEHEIFEAWWQVYPNRAGRDGAERAYAAALRDGADPDELLRGVERYRLRKPTGQAWMNPATWLTQRRWLDEPIAPEDRPGKPPSASQRVRAEILRTMGRGVVPLPEEDGKIVNGNATRG